MTDRRARDIWDAILGELQVRVTRPSFETWLKDTTGISYSGSTLTVGTPSAFAAEMLGNRMYSLISETASGVAKMSVEVKFRVVQRGHHSEDSMRPSNNGFEGEAAAVPPMRDAGFRIDSRFTFDNFVVGPSNALAHAAAGAVCDQPGAAYNPLFIYSNSGLGKTHLLQAIGHKVREEGLSLLYASTEQFTNEYIGAIRSRTTEEFRDKYRGPDLLLLDDIQFIIGKEQTQEGFFHTFNSLHMGNKQIVITCDRPVSLLSSLADRIKSRLQGGLVVDIQPPDLETRVAILESKAEKQGLEIETDIMLFLAEMSPQNVRELEGNLNRVVAYSQLTQTPINMELVKRALADAVAQQASRLINEDSILNAVAAYYSTDPNAIASRKRDKKTALARHIAMYLLRLELNKQFAEIGRLLGGKDHTTVIHACNKIASRINSDASLRSDVLNIRGLIQSKGNKK